MTDSLLDEFYDRLKQQNLDNNASESFTDDFGNECSQDFIINHFDNIINDVITLNFGAPPIMPDYNSNDYY